MNQEKNGVTIGGVGINSTSDQNIFIFEREVLKETKEEIEQKKQLLKEQQEKEEQLKFEKLKESINSFEDLMKDPKKKKKLNC